MESRINVCVRIKPLKKGEEINDKNNLWNITDEKVIVNSRTNETFNFDKVFNQEYSTTDIFEQNIKNHIESAVKGINVTIFAYGQTSSGKTFTMRGSEECPGLIPLTINEIFRLTADGKSGSNCKVTCSYMEIYNESVNDLLNPKNKNLGIRESVSKGIHIQGLTTEECKDQKTMIELLEAGENARITAATNLNEQSSRSHSVFRFNIEISEKKKNGEISTKTSQFNLVDLAGSEGVSRTKSQGIRFREGSNINKSLLALSKVIHRLSSNEKKGKVFINYRDSKLTRILQPSLGGNSQTIVICTLSQLFVNYQESVKTLLFGQMAKNVRTIVNVNEVVKNKDALELKAAKQENEELKDQIHQLEIKLKEIAKSKGNGSNKNSRFSTPNNDGNKENLESKAVLDEVMEVDQNEASHNSSGSNLKSTITHLKDQISYLHGKIFTKSEEIEQKDLIIRKIQSEKFEIEQKYEEVDAKENEARKEIELLKEQLASNADITVESIKKEFEKNQNKEILDADGIQCFNINSEDSNDDCNFLSSLEKKSQGKDSHLDMEFKLKKLILQQEATISKLTNELELLTDNSVNMKNEIRLLNECERLKTEELDNAEQEIIKLKEEIKFFQESNKELVNSIDEVEKTLQEIERGPGISMMDSSKSESSYHKIDKRSLLEENDRLNKETNELQSRCHDLSFQLQKVDSDKSITQKKLETAESNIEILNETLEFMSNENSQFKDQLARQKEVIDFKRKEIGHYESDLEEIKKKFSTKKRMKKAQSKESSNNKFIKEIENLKLQIQDYKEQLEKKEKEYNELKVTVDKVKKIKGDYDSVVKREKQSLKAEFDKQKKSLLQEVDEYKYKSYNVLNDNASLKKKIKSLNNTILDRDIEIKTHKQDKEKYMLEIVDLKVNIKESERVKEQLETKNQEEHRKNLVKQAKMEAELEAVHLKEVENRDVLYNYKKFAKNMNDVIKIFIKGSDSAIEATKDKEQFNTIENECYKCILEQKEMLLKVQKKINLKRQSGFKVPDTKAHPAIKIGYSEDEPTTTDENAGVKSGRKRVRIDVD
ncbi:unnamed protein product [Moneuplotes crassus]|uniref:Kinesin motor domain-containing protein n=1 Tax=Euplotes crassus TaxID=5936 RepID=A0AAD1XRN4_EUPCR|nr:unnamed protein product [Moneuplotes crassus]